MKLMVFIPAVMLVVVPFAMAAKKMKKETEPVVELPALVVFGTHIPSSWLEVAWECRGPMPIDCIKRAWISKVASDSPAARAGFKAGDTLLALGGVSVEAMTGFSLEANLQREREVGAREEFLLQTPHEKERTVVLVFQKK